MTVPVQWLMNSSWYCIWIFRYDEEKLKLIIIEPDVSKSWKENVIISYEIKCTCNKNDSDKVNGKGQIWQK